MKRDLSPFYQGAATAYPDPIIDPADYHHAVETLKELLAFWLMVNCDAPDRSMGQSFVQAALAVLKTAETQYRQGDGLEVVGMVDVGECPYYRVI